jgi:hypothetical protein
VDGTIAADFHGIELLCRETGEEYSVPHGALALTLSFGLWFA